MSSITVVLVGVIGLFVAAAVWNMARNQAAKLPLFQSRASGSGEGSTLSWFPLYAFGAARDGTADESRPSSRRPLFEIAVAAYFALAAWRVDDRLDLLAVLVFSVPLLVILLVDAWTRLIHTNIIMFGILAGWVFSSFDGLRTLGSSAIAMVAAAVAFAVLYLLAVVIYRNPKVVPFGLGDVYLAAMIGAMVRLDAIARALLYGVLLAGISLALLLVLKRVNRKQAVPYGPFLVAGALYVLVF